MLLINPKKWQTIKKSIKGGGGILLMDQINEISKLHLDYNCIYVIYDCAIPRFYSLNEMIKSVKMHDIHNFVQTVNHSTTYLFGFFYFQKLEIM